MLEIGLMTSGEGGVRLGKEAKGFQISPPNSFGSACSPYIFDLSKYQQTFLFSWSLRPLTAGASGNTLGAFSFLSSSS